MLVIYNIDYTHVHSWLISNQPIFHPMLLSMGLPGSVMGLGKPLGILEFDIIQTECTANSVIALKAKQL